MEALIARNPRNAKALNYVGYTLAEENRDLQRALELITTALKETPEADYILDSLAWVQYRLGQFELAWVTIQRSLAAGGDDPTIWEHYGDIALALKKNAEAIRGYTKALSKKTANAEAIRTKLAKIKKEK